MIHLFIVLASIFGYLVVGMIIGRSVARFVYVYERQRYSSLAYREGARWGLGEAITVLTAVALLWPAFLLGFTAYRLACATYLVTGKTFIPEYRVELNKEVEAELEQKIREQKAEIDRLAWNIKGQS
jgi:hypothetical protein